MTPTRGDDPEVVVDTSVAVALCVADHEHHLVAATALRGRRVGLSGHAAFETFSVLTRLPAPARRSPTVVARLIATNFGAISFLSVEGSRNVLARLAEGEISGGSVYDALVGAAAAEHGIPLATLDRRALDVYRVLGVQIELLDVRRTS